jgi:hypothetical protein
MNRETQIQLSKPWNTNLIKQMDKGFGKIDYVEHTQVVQKLIALIPDLEMKLGDIIYDEITDSNDVKRTFVTGIMVSLTGTIDGYRKTVQEFGMCDKPFFHENPNKVSNNGQRIKECISDGYKRSAMRLGVGLELYDTDAWLSNYLTKEDKVTEEE